MQMDTLQIYIPSQKQIIRSQTKQQQPVSESNEKGAGSFTGIRIQHFDMWVSCLNCFPPASTSLSIVNLQHILYCHGYFGEKIVCSCNHFPPQETIPRTCPTLQCLCVVLFDIMPTFAKGVCLASALASTCKAETRLLLFQCIWLALDIPWL